MNAMFWFYSINILIIMVGQIYSMGQKRRIAELERKITELEAKP